MGKKIPYDDSADIEVYAGGRNPYSLYTETRAKPCSNECNPPKKKKKQKIELPVIDDYECTPSITDFHKFVDFDQSSEREGNNVPPGMVLNVHCDPGFVFGSKEALGTDKYIGMPQGEEGNILVDGGNGSGKSHCIAKPTLRAWRGALVATDIKGELSACYGKMFAESVVERPFIVFDPMCKDGLGYGYDPFWWPATDDKENLVSNIWEIVIAIITPPGNSNYAYWTETEQGILAASLYYYFKQGHSFSQAVEDIMTSTVSSFVSKVKGANDGIVDMFLGELANMRPEDLASFDRGLRNKLMLFATDPYIQNAFRGSRENAQCFNWGDLDECNIFLKIPKNKIEQWGGAINLMLTQLIRHLERKPDMHSPEGRNLLQTLLLLDEIARFGKLEILSSAISTLRSNRVNFCLMVQSIAQLDKFYGEHDRRIIIDNCQYIAMLRANDAETKQTLSDLIGDIKVAQKSLSESLDEDMNLTGYSMQLSEEFEPLIHPHEFAYLKDIPLITPYGFCRVEKIGFNEFATATTEVAPIKKFSFVVDVSLSEPESPIGYIHKSHLESDITKPTAKHKPVMPTLISSKDS